MSKGTPHRPIRISDDLWAKAQAKATEEGTTASEVIRAALTLYVANPDMCKHCGDAIRLTEGRWEHTETESMYCPEHGHELTTAEPLVQVVPR